MLVCYDLQLRVPTYDFFIWLVLVRMFGATSINISLGRKFLMRKKWPVQETQERIKNYILPGPPLLANIPCQIGDEGFRSIGSPDGLMFYADLLNAAVSLKKPLPLLTTSDRAPYAQAKFCSVTLRQTFYKPERNSDEDVWRAFAAKIGAVVIEDHSRVPMTLANRMAIYASAEMNYGVPTGPTGLLELTPYPVTVFSDPAVNDASLPGLNKEGQRPWALGHQRIVWERPTVESLLKYHRSLPR